MSSPGSNSSWARAAAPEVVNLDECRRMVTGIVDSMGTSAGSGRKGEK